MSDTDTTVSEEQPSEVVEANIPDVTQAISSTDPAVDAPPIVHVTGEEVDYTDHAGKKHVAFLEHLIAGGEKLMAHLHIKGTGDHIDDVPYDVNGEVHSWQHKQ